MRLTTRNSGKSSWPNSEQSFNNSHKCEICGSEDWAHQLGGQIFICTLQYQADTSWIVRPAQFRLVIFIFWNPPLFLLAIQPPVSKVARYQS